MQCLKERGNAFLPVILAIVIAAVIGVGWHLHAHAKRVSNPVALGGHLAPGLPKGTTTRTYTFEDRLLPDAPTGYTLLRQGITSTNDPTVPPGLIEADYLTSKPVSSIHSDALALCSAHNFKYQPGTGSTAVIKCFAQVASWTFVIKPASSIIDQAWYQGGTQIDESTLAASRWLQVLSGPTVIN